MFNTLRTSMLLAALTGLFMGVGYFLGGVTGMLIAFIFAAATNLWAYWNSDKMALKMYKAQEVGPTHGSGNVRRYAERVRELATNAGMPVPKVYIIQNEQPNAFATGRNPENAAVAATTGLLKILSEQELAGVMAHELAHVKNRDTLTMTITATLAGAITMLANFALFFRSGNRGAGGVFGVIAIMILAPLAAALVQMSVSRGREYEADRLGAKICGKPEKLASALAKISSGAARTHNEIAERHPETGQMMIINPLIGGGRDKLFSTHPATQNRIDRLMAMSGVSQIRLDPEGPSPFEAPKRGPWG